MSDRGGTRGIARIVGKRLGAAVGLAITVLFTRGLQEAAIEGFAESLGDGIGGLVIALLATVFAIVLVYMTLGSQVEAVTSRLTALATGNVEALRDRDGSGPLIVWADGVAAPIFALLGLVLARAGAREANASWAMLGFSALGLALLSLVSSIVHRRFERRRGQATALALDASKTAKSGEIAAIFVSVAVLSTTASSAIFAAAPQLRGGTLAPARGEWAKVCVGDGPGCQRVGSFTFTPERGGATLLEVVGRRPGTLRVRGKSPALDAAGKPITLTREPGTELTFRARFVPASAETYELLLEEPGLYSVRWRNAP
jgi:hypothetical protein